MQSFEYTTYFRSVIAFGSVNQRENFVEKIRLGGCWQKKYVSPFTAEYRENAIRKEEGVFCILALSIDYISGEEAIELVQKRTAAV